MKYDNVTTKDAQFLYDLLYERPTYANISHREMPTYDAHCAFIKSKPYKEWFVIRSDEGKSFGSIYLSDLNEVGLFIAAKYQRLGIGSMAWKWMSNRHPKDVLYANISPTNLVAINFMRKMGWKLIQQTYERV